MLRLYAHLRIYLWRRSKMREFVKAFKALSDETRVRILKLLLERECCVCEVMQALDISQSRASRNLGILHDAGFIKARRDGLWVLYSIDEKGMASYFGVLIELLRDSLDRDETILMDSERLKGAVRAGPGCDR